MTSGIADMKVLVACERSGVVRQAFRNLGHEAWSCDLVPADDGSLYHHQADALHVAENEDWDLMIAHPPCTYLSVSGARWWKDRKQQQKDAAQFAYMLLSCNIPRVAMENPIGYLSTYIRKPEQIIQPYQFGHDASKATCLWLNNLPKLQHTKHVPPRLVCKCGFTYWAWNSPKGCPKCGAEEGLAKPRWANQTDSGQNCLGPSPTRAADRARTYTGIAAAMANQWGIL